MIIPEQINAVRGSMRREIIKGLFSVFNNFCSAACYVHEKSIKAYIDAIRNTGIWPLEDLPKKSNKSIVDSPGFMNWKAKVPFGACSSCTGRLSGKHVHKTREDVIDYWDGFCLDCMDESKPKTGDTDEGYWEHNNLQNWDYGCEINHGRNTWYFSYMGRKEAMDAFNREQQERKRERRRNGFFGGT
jgi:hypothetical protein